MTTSHQTELSPDSRQPTILIVDDEAAIRLTIEFSLANSGYTILEAEDGRTALEICEQIPPDLVLLDVVMDEMDGFAVCRALRQSQIGKYLPVILMTSLDDEETILTAFDAGATDFITKPLNLLILGFRLRYWLRSSSILLELHNSQQRLTKARDIAKLAHWEWDPESDALSFECSQPGDFGLQNISTMHDYIGRVIDQDRGEVQSVIAKARRNHTSFSVQFRIRDVEGLERIIHNQGEFQVSPGTQRICAVGIFQDVTQLKQAENTIRYLAFYDSLTGLANRSLFKEHWKELHAAADRAGQSIAILFIDLDHFKQINDTFGHQIGDQVLITVAERLKRVMRLSDVISRSKIRRMDPLISRLGGDEFNILAPHLTAPEQAATIAERIIEVVDQPIDLGTNKFNITASVGISIYPEDGRDIDTLIKHADTAMYEAKKLGRNNYQFFHAKMNDVVHARFQLQNRLREALANGEFALYYQPKVKGKSDTILGVEALIRWMDPERGLLIPEQFIPFAEEHGFIHYINDWVILESCKQAQRWVEDGLFANCRVSINISGNNLKFGTLEKRIRSCLLETGLAPRYLEIELTERVMMQNPDEAKEMLMNLRSMGISIAIDDFGTGYSALSHLQHFPLSTLKIDKSFINNIENSENGAELLLSIINIGKCLNLTVVAEGVETESQRSALDKMECDELQGFLFCHPLPASEVYKLLAAARTP